MSRKITPEELAGYIDHTLLKPDAVADDLDNMIADCLRYGFKTICINSCWVEYVSAVLEGSDIRVCSVVGFPLGAMITESKAFEAEKAITKGASELDMVMNIGALISGDSTKVENDIALVKKVCQDHILKVILETCLLTDDQKVMACKIAVNAGADFVKTSTGFSTGGATVIDVRLMREAVGLQVGVKASGGIKTWEDALAMIDAGANRLGMGASVAVIKGAKR